MYWARSLLMVSGATIMSAWPLSSSPIIPFHSFLLLLFTCTRAGQLRLATTPRAPFPPAPPRLPAAYPLLSAELAVSHQVHLVGEVHGACQLDEQVHAEAIAALWHRVARCGRGRSRWSRALPAARAQPARPPPPAHSRPPGDVSLGPVQMTFLTGSPFTVDSSLHVPSLSVGFT